VVARETRNIHDIGFQPVDHEAGRTGKRLQRSHFRDSCVRDNEGTVHFQTAKLWPASINSTSSPIGDCNHVRDRDKRDPAVAR